MKVRLPRQSRVENVTVNVDLLVDYLTGAMPARQKKLQAHPNATIHGTERLSNIGQHYKTRFR